MQRPRRDGGQLRSAFGSIPSPRVAERTQTRVRSSAERSEWRKAQSSMALQYDTNHRHNCASL